MTIDDCLDEIYRSDDYARDIPFRHRENMRGAIAKLLNETIDSLRAELERVKQERDEKAYQLSAARSDNAPLMAALSARDEEIRQLREQLRVRHDGEQTS